MADIGLMKITYNARPTGKEVPRENKEEVEGIFGMNRL